MKNEWDKRYTTIALYVVLVIIVSVVAVFFIIGARDFFINKQYTGIFKIMTPFLCGFVFAYLLNPLFVFCKNKIFFRLFSRKGTHEKHKKAINMLSLVTTYIITLILVGLLIFMIIPQVGSSIKQLANKVSDWFTPYEEQVQTENNTVQQETKDNITENKETPTEKPIDSLTSENFEINEKSINNTKIGVYINNITTSIQNYIDGFGIELDIQETINNVFFSFLANITNISAKYLSPFFNTTASIIFSTATGIINFLLGILISIYILSSKDNFIAQFKKLSFAVFSESFTKKIIDLFRKIHLIIGDFINGKILDSLIIGILCFIGMSIFNINYAMLISVIVGITNVIPFFGPFIGAVPSIFFLLINDPYQAIWFTVFILILQQIDGNIIGPKIIGSTIGLSSFWVIFSILFMNGIFGLFGMFMGVPLFAVIYILVKEAAEARLAKKGLPTGTEDYIETNPIKSVSEVPQEKKENLTTRIDKLVKSISNKIHKPKK